MYIKSYQATSWTGLILAIALLCYGCGEMARDPVAPEASSSSRDVHLTGQVNSSIWQAQDQGFAYVGTVSSYAEVTLAGKSVSASAGPATPVTLPPSSMKSSGITISALEGSDGVELFDVLSAAA